MSKLDQIADQLENLKLPDVNFEAYYQALETDKAKLKRVVDYFDELEDFIDNGETMKGAKLPFSKLDNLFGFRDGEVTLWTGYNGHKKSMFVGFIMIEMLKQGFKSCVASFEMKPVSTIIRMAKQYTGTGYAGASEIGDFMQFTASNFYIYDQMGGISPTRLYGVIHYAAKELGIKHFVIDSLMRVVSGEDNYNDQKDFVVKLCEIAISANIHIHLIHHVRDGDESKPTGRYSAKGSKAISDNVHNSLVVWSNKNGIEDMPDVILKCDKQREGSWEGMVALDFNKDNLTFSEKFNGY
jgi:twinkle protein